MPNGNQGRQYLDALEALLRRAVQTGQMTKTEAQSEADRATELLNTGAYGTSLPYFDVIYQKRKWWQSDPSWRLGEEAGAQMALSPEIRAFQQYREMGMTPSDAMEWATQKVGEDVTGAKPMSEYEQWQQQKWYMEQGIEAQRATGAEAQLGAEREQMGRWTGQMEQAARAQGRGWETREADIRRDMQAEMAQKFEMDRLQRAAGFGGPGSWIQRWQTMNEPNPYAASPLEEREPSTFAQEFAEEYGIQPREAERLALGLAAGGGGMLKAGELEQLQAKPLDIRQELAWVGMGAQGAQGAPAVARPTAPPAPYWLPQFAPGQVAGQPITKQRIPTPSGQQWARTPPSVQAGLGGYAEWAGGRPLEDILAHQLAMRPRTPTGAGSPYWRPAGQWA